jgi:hypothetical protein
MLTLSLQRSRAQPQTEFDVIWTSEEFGARRVGCIVRTGNKWEWRFELPTAVPVWAHGLSRDQSTAMAAFRITFEGYHRQASQEQLAEALAEAHVTNEPTR